MKDVLESDGKTNRGLSIFQISRRCQHLLVKIVQHRTYGCSELCCIGGMNMGQMNDGSECLLCELWQDVDDKSDLELCCRECREEIAWAFARRRAGDE